MTRFGAVVRADSVRQLTKAGWEDLVAYGVRTIVDLRLGAEMATDPPHDDRVEFVHVPIAREEDEAHVTAAWRSSPDVLGAYQAMVERLGPNLALAVEAVATAPPGGVLVHCFAGKDRTGLVCAVLLRLAGVGREDIAADYGLSAENLAPLFHPWVVEARDDEELAVRRRMTSSPPEAMADLLAWLEERNGSVAAYLLDAGASASSLDRARERLLR
jgi:protein-tyrosine phosphatase